MIYSRIMAIRSCPEKEIIITFDPYVGSYVTTQLHGRMEKKNPVAATSTRALRYVT